MIFIKRNFFAAILLTTLLIQISFSDGCNTPCDVSDCEYSSNCSENDCESYQTCRTTCSSACRSHSCVDRCHDHCCNRNHNCCHKTSCPPTSCTPSCKPTASTPTTDSPTIIIPITPTHQDTAPNDNLVSTINNSNNDTVEATVNINNSISLQNNISVPITVYNDNRIDVKVVLDSDYTSKEKSCDTKTATCAPQDRITVTVPYPVPIPVPSETKTVTVRVPVPVPGPPIFIPAPYPVIVPRVQSGCCCVINPCLYDTDCQPFENMCGSMCTSNYLYAPSNPCSDGCYRRPFGTSFSCYHSGQCQKSLTDCSMCNDDFYLTFDNYRRCAGCFYRR